MSNINKFIKTLDVRNLVIAISIRITVLQFREKNKKEIDLYNIRSYRFREYAEFFINFYLIRIFLIRPSCYKM